MLSLDSDDYDALGFGGGWERYADKAYTIHLYDNAVARETRGWKYQHDIAFRTRVQGHMRKYMRSEKGKATKRAYRALPRVLEADREYKRKKRAALPRKPKKPPLSPEEIRARNRAKALKSYYKRKAEKQHESDRTTPVAAPVPGA